jgi:hypothetical protein
MEISPTYDTDSSWVIKTAYFVPDSSSPSRLIAIQRLYALPEHGRWVLSPALPRLTHGWQRTSLGRLTYHYPAGVVFSPASARRAAAFVDSLSQALDIQPPARIDYYLTQSTGEMYRALGLDFYILPSGPSAGRGGYAFPKEGVVLAGNPSLGPAYTHELVHILLAPLTPDSGRLALMEEGTATWLGGSGGQPFKQLLGSLLKYQAEHPEVTLWDLLRGEVSSGWGSAEAQAYYITAALIVDSIYRRGGTAQLKKALQLPASTSLEQTLFPSFVGVAAAEGDQWWRACTANRRIRPVCT